MVRYFSGRHRLWALTLVGVVLGCALPAPPNRGVPVAVPADVPAGAAERAQGPSSSAPISEVLPLAYHAPADIPLAAPASAVGLPPSPGRVLAGAAQQDPSPRVSTASAGYSLQPVDDDGSPVSPYPPGDSADPLVDQAELSVDELVAEVQARNPSLQAVSAAWRAAADRYPQVIALDDPMFAWMVGLDGVGGMDDGWMVQASQRIPWAGKRPLRGRIASAEAGALRGDIGDRRLLLAEAARVAFSDYYQAWRQMEVNAQSQALVRDLREVARQKYELNQVTRQDVLQADVELADLAMRAAELKRDQQVAQARINTLLHRAVDRLLPPPPTEMPLPDELPAVDDLQQAAVSARPDLYAQVSRIRAAEAGLALVCREYYPDLNIVAKYDAFMPEEMRPQVGMDINIPIRNARRFAAVHEAQNTLAQRRAEYQTLLDTVRFEVQSTYIQVTQAAEAVRLYREHTLPAAENSLASAQATYTTGSLDFLRLLDAERRLNDQREKYHASIAEYHRRLAALDRAVGTPVP